jgi:hypothetical protein
VHCFFSFEPGADLYGVTFTEADGRQWAVVLDATEFADFADRVVGSPWLVTAVAG